MCRIGVEEVVGVCCEIALHSVECNAIWNILRHEGCGAALELGFIMCRFEYLFV